MTSGVGSHPSHRVLPAVGFVLADRRAALVGVAATAFVGGLAEAVFLVIVTRSAFAISEGSDRVAVLSGLSLSVEQALIAAFAVVLVRITMAVLAVLQSSRLSTRAVGDLRRRLAKAFLHSTWPVQQQQRGGSFQELIGGYSSQASIMTSGLGQGAVAAANLAALLGLAIAVDPVGAVVLVLTVTALGLALRPLRGAVRKRAAASAVAGMDLATAVNEVSVLGVELHVFNVQVVAEQRLSARIGRSEAAARRLQFAAGSSSALYVGFAYLALLAALGIVAASNVSSLAALGAAMLVMLRSLSYGQALQGAFVSVGASVPALVELMGKIDEFEQGEDHDGGQPIGRLNCLAVEGVSFAYDGAGDVLHDISFEVGPREIIGIIGPSGSGKSTLVQLLLRLREPRIGAVLADGRDIRLVAKADWSRRVAFVPQSFHLITGSIADNIRFFRAHVTDEDVVRAARLAHVHDEILARLSGYDSSVGEHGGHLSGGQQQRICIARALVDDPDLLILDEPTSALDVQSEHLIRQTLLTLKAKMTVIVIAHRLSTLDICDRIMVIQGGEIVGFDSPSNLEASSAFYRNALALSGLR